MLSVILVVAAFIGLLFLGMAVGGSQNPAATTVGTNEPDRACGALGAQFDQRRSERCQAEGDERSAEARLASLEAQRNGFLAAAAIATAAGFAAMLIPVFGVPVAAGFFAAAAASTALAAGLQGAMFAAEADRAGKATVAKQAREREAEARRILLERCPEEAGRWLSIPSPC